MLFLLFSILFPFLSLSFFLVEQVLNSMKLNLAFPESFKVIVLLLLISLGNGDSLLIVFDITLLTTKLLFLLGVKYIFFKVLFSLFFSGFIISTVFFISSLFI